MISTTSRCTKGRHSWDHTHNNCGFDDLTLFSSRYAGATSRTVHSYRDSASVVDFGSLAPFTSDRTAIAIFEAVVAEW